MNIIRLDFGNDITKVRNQLKPNIQMLKNRTFAIELLKKVGGKTPLNKIIDSIIQKITQEQLNNTIDSLIEKINGAKFEINIFLLLFIEALYAIKPKIERENDKIIEKLIFIINQRAIITNDFKDISVTSSESQNEENYDYFFALMLRQMSLQNITQFLDYHSEKFEGNFHEFLKLCLLEHDNLLDTKSISVANGWLMQNANKEKGIGIDLKIKWTGDENKNQFVQLIYGLYKAKLLNNGEGEITKIIEDLSNLLKVDLNKNWQSNHSGSIHQQNNDYNPEIFDKRKNAYKVHANNLKQLKKTKIGKN